jgi:formylglycine-generating enzyme required for sulfatase activity
MDLQPDPKDGAAVDNPARLDHPVVNVDWCDAAAFCRWAGKRLCGKIGGGPISLGDATFPALSQWAFACTRGGTRMYPWGDAPRPTACNVGKTEALPIKTVAVKSKSECQGGFDGLYDMMGNAEEWIDGCRDEPGQGLLCAIIGGAYLDTTQGGRCDNNIYDDPIMDQWRARSFRCCS